MRKTLISHLHRVREASVVGWEFPKLIDQRYGMYNFDNYMVFKRNGFMFRISYEDAILWYSHEVSIYIDDIKVYQDGWIHNTPNEMKKEIKNTVKEIEKINKKWRKDKLGASYRKLQRKKKKDKKLEKIRLFEDEKKRLHEKYANKETK